MILPMIFHREDPYFLLIRQGTDTRESRNNTLGILSRPQTTIRLTVVLCRYTISGIPRYIVYGV